MQSFTLNGLNLVINCTEVGKENTEPKPQLMQRGKPPDVRLFVRAAFAECLTCKSTSYSKCQAGSSSSPMSLQCWLCRPNVPCYFFYPVSLSWVTQTQREQHVMKGQGSKGKHREVLLCKAGNNFSPRAFHSSQCAAEMSVKKAVQLPAEVLFYSAISHNCIYLPKQHPPTTSRLCTMVTNRSMESCY